MHEDADLLFALGSRRDDALEVEVRIIPGSRRSRVIGRYGDRVKISVAAAPEKGRANDALRRLLAVLMGVPLKGVAIVRGETSRDKRVRIEGLKGG